MFSRWPLAVAATALLSVATPLSISGTVTTTTFNVCDYGAVGDGRTLNTQVLQHVVRLVEQQGAGTMLLPAPGVYLSAPFNLTSNIVLLVEAGATLLATDDSSLWPLLPPLPSYGRGRDHDGWRYSSFIHADGVSNVSITGGGAIDGQGAKWWKDHNEGKEVYTRGRLIEVMNCEQLRITNLTLRNSPFWTIHPVYCDDVVVADVNIFAPLDSPNTDGIDPDSCSNVLIERCYVESGDDGIAIKSGWDCFGQAFNRPTVNITIRDFTRKGIKAAGIAIGSEVSGGVEAIRMHSIRVIAAEGEQETNAIHLKTGKTRGGYIKGVEATGIQIHGASLGVKISKDYGSPNPACGNDSQALANPYSFEGFELPVLRDILIQNVTGHVLTQAFYLTGLWFSPVVNVTIEDAELAVTAPGSTSPWQCEYIFRSQASHVNPPACPALLPRTF